MAHTHPILNNIAISKVLLGSDKRRKSHRKIIATEFGPLGGPALISTSWRGAASDSPAVTFWAMEEVLFRTGGVFPG